MSKYPVPETRQGWFAAFVLIILSFILYYVWLYPTLEQAYYGDFWNSPPYSLEGLPLKIDIHIPRYVYSFVEREIRVQVRNFDPMRWFQVSVVAAVSDAPDGTFVLLCDAESGKATGCDQGSSVLSFGEVPPSAVVTRSVWITAQKIRNEKPSDGQEASLQETPTVAPLLGEGDERATPPGEDNASENVQLAFFIMTKGAMSGEEAVEADTIEDGQDGWQRQRISLQGASFARVDVFGTLLQSFIKIILLPPWSNGLLPALALVVTTLFERPLTAALDGKHSSVTEVAATVPKTGASDSLCLKARRWSKLIITQSGWPAAWLATQIGLMLVVVYLPQVLLNLLDVVNERGDSILLPGRAMALIGGAAFTIGGIWPRIKWRHIHANKPDSLTGTHSSADRTHPAEPPSPSRTPPDHPVEAQSPSDEPIEQELDTEIRVTSLEELKPLLQSKAGPVYLRAVLRVFPTLPQFADRFLLIDQPTPKHMSVLKKWVQETTSTALAKSAQSGQLPSGFLSRLLDLCLRHIDQAAVQFSGGADLLTTLIDLPQAKDVLREELMRDVTKREQKDHERLIAKIRELLPESQCTACNLMELFHVLKDPTPEEYKKFLDALLRETRRDGLLAACDQFRHFLEQGRELLGGPLLQKLDGKAIASLQDVGPQLACIDSWAQFLVGDGSSPD